MFSVSELTAKEMLAPSSVNNSSSAAEVNKSYPFQPTQLLFLYSADNWEEFLLEWGHFQKQQYALVTRLGGANDMGIDVACFATDKGFQGNWDNYQCKHYKDALNPGTAIKEIGKFLWHVHQGDVSLPDNYYFFAPKDCGPSLKKLLLQMDDLKSEVIARWDKLCAKTITSTQTIPLDGEFLGFVEDFDFSIFKYKPTLAVVEEHRQTPYFKPRFGGGFTQPRPSTVVPPPSIQDTEQRYIEQLMEAYSDHTDSKMDHGHLAKHPKLHRHFSRSRETFYEAEALRVFARDSVPEGTFQNLQDNVYHGVIDIHDGEHADGLARVRAVTDQASKLNVSGNGLIHVVEVRDLKGICHQLANEDRLTWVEKDDD